MIRGFRQYLFSKFSSTIFARAKMRKCGALFGIVAVIIAAIIAIDHNITYDPFESEQIQEDEEVTFISTIAKKPNFDANDLKEIEIPIHAWVYENKHHFPFSLVFSLVRDLIGSYLSWRNGHSHILSDAEIKLLQLRGDMFFVDNQRGKKIDINFCNQIHHLPPSASNGHVVTNLNVDRATFEECIKIHQTPHNPSQEMLINFYHSTNGGRMFEGEVIFLPEKGLSVISDIDDTLRVTVVAKKAATLRNTFLREFVSVPGMAKIYKKWTDYFATENGTKFNNIAFHYVSGTPWPLHDQIKLFLHESGFPSGSLHLRPFTWGERSVLQMITAPVTSKYDHIHKIFKEFPHRQFLLIGDSGEKDPEIYADFYKMYPGQVIGILIRSVPLYPDHDLTNYVLVEINRERFDSCFKEVPRNKWLVFDDPEQADRFMDQIVESPNSHE